MKKVLLTGTALLAFAAASLAQSNQTFTNQNGSYQTARQNQDGSYLKSTINQDKQDAGNQGSYALTNQMATGSAGNEAFIEQNRNSYSNRAGLTQSGGADNRGSIQQNNSSGGNGNQILEGASAVDVKATGGNWAGILQQGSGNGTGNGPTYVHQNGNSSSNFGEVYQYGNNSRQTSIEQSANSRRNNATINQGTSGSPVDLNQATVYQQNGSYDNKAKVDQTSQGNIAYTRQDNSSERNEVNVMQAGQAGAESAYVNQNTGSYDNKANVNQSGFGDFAYVTQDNNSYRNQATVDQRRNAGGFGNTAEISQVAQAADNKATVTQDGRGGNARVIQTNAQQNEATISQNLGRPDGGYNTADVRQGSSGMAAYNNVAVVSQDYSKNQARLEQYGYRNRAMLTQEIGDLNVIKGTNGDFALQMGDDNKMTVTQNSGPNGNYVPNTASVSQIGNNNTATVSQMGHN